jgi:hypothetical protein
MRQALVNANPDLAAANSKYVMRITGDNPESRVCARDSRRVDPSPPGLAQGDGFLCPGSPCGRSRTRLPVGPPGTTAPTNGLTASRMRSAYCLRGFGTTAPAPLRQYARAYAYPGLRAFASLSMARSDRRPTGSVSRTGTVAGPADPAARRPGSRWGQTTRGPRERCPAARRHAACCRASRPRRCAHCQGAGRGDLGPLPRRDAVEHRRRRYRPASPLGIRRRTSLNRSCHFLWRKRKS